MTFEWAQLYNEIKILCLSDPEERSMTYRIMDLDPGNLEVEHQHDTGMPIFQLFLIYIQGPYSIVMTSWSKPWIVDKKCLKSVVMYQQLRLFLPLFAKYKSKLRSFQLGPP